MQKKGETCGCCGTRRALVILPLDTTVPIDPDETGEWPVVKPEPPQPPPGWDAVE
jgi:hypothetical protein